MIFKKVIDYNMDENCYIIGNDSLILIDPGNVYDKIMKETDGMSVSHILLTHCHYDHISGVKKLKEKTGALVISGEKCKKNIKNPAINVSLMFGDYISEDLVDITYKDGDEFSLSGINIKLIETPGHTDCSVCYLIDNKLFSGDTLFLRTTGRWDLPTGNFNELERSVRGKLYKMDESTEVYPGHGGKTGIGYEKKFNMSISEKEI